ncbi:type IV pilin protein [Marinobacterium litorale]|uniref:type IV pilin protein n=1 Tax=Marinobacterium litorale TaxID=404770 RepID=UPI003CCC13B0
MAIFALTKAPHKARGSKGFTLIEVMIVVVVIGILAAIAYPSYTDYVRKSRRADGMNTLMALQLAQEKMRANCKYYAYALAGADVCNSAGTVDAHTTTVDFDSASPEGYYTIAILITDDDGNDVRANSVRYVAKATAQGDQAQDDEEGQSCATLTLTVNAANPQGDRAPEECW